MRIKNLNCTEFEESRQNDGCIVLDVREPEEFESSHVPGAISLPLSTLGGAVIPSASVIILYCQSGYRSKVAAEFLVHQIQNGALDGVDEVMHLKPGYRQWVIENEAGS